MKRWIKEKIIGIENRRYHRLLERKSISYDAWIRKREVMLEQELKEMGEVSKLTFRWIPYEAAQSYVTMYEMEEEESADITVFLAQDGKASVLSEAAMSRFFLANPHMSLAYGDEDVISPDGLRYTPWLKPDWSPDTFLSYFYFGSVFAVRTSIWKELLKEEIASFGGNSVDNPTVWIYRMCCLLAKKAGGFERRTQGELNGNSPIGHIDEILFHSYSNREMNLLYNDDILEVEDFTDSSNVFDRNITSERETPLVSVIIPSKDNEEVLRRCIESIREVTELPYEIIVVDNGSREDTKNRLEAYLKGLAVSGTYIYEPMEFHFSRMCNRGALEASGEVLLFLNDDVEVPQREEGLGWMEGLYNQAVRPYAGAVGVKLLYPNTKRIQHGGIVNQRLGPVHKLQFKDNDACYYYGWNCAKRNVIAVTGACLAVQLEKWKEAGGFPEELPVAFNDVDLCFSLYEKGYYNVVLQETVLYHWESLSRGQDEEEGKLNRLLTEKRKLYERHPELYGKDPFYHKYLAGDMLSTGFELKADYEWKEDLSFGKPISVSGIADRAREEPCVIISLEYAGTVEEWRSGQVPKCEDEYYIQGYSFVSGSNNACYDKKILLQSGKKQFCIIPELLPRGDVEQNLPDQENVGLTGFAVRLRKGDLEDGRYRIGVLAQDRCTGHKLFCWTERYLEVKGCRRKS